MFSALRANDLIWSYVVNNYLKGKHAGGVRPALLERRQHQPARADVLLVRAQHVPGEQAARAGRADQCSACRSTWRACDRADLHPRDARGPHRAVEDRRTARSQLLGGEKRFVLGASGHVAGVINPASKNRRSYWADEHVSAGPGGLAGRRGRARRGAGGRTGLPGSHSYGGGKRKAPKKAGQCPLPGDRAGAGPLCEAEGKSRRTEENSNGRRRHRCRGAHRHRQVRRHAGEDSRGRPGRARDPQAARRSGRASRSRCPR